MQQCRRERSQLTDCKTHERFNKDGIMFLIESIGRTATEVVIVTRRNEGRLGGLESKLALERRQDLGSLGVRQWLRPVRSWRGATHGGSKGKGKWNTVDLQRIKWWQWKVEKLRKKKKNRVLLGSKWN